MKKAIMRAYAVVIGVCLCSIGYAAALDLGSLGESKIGSGIKESLRVGITDTIRLLGRNDGYFANQSAKILLPEGLRKVEPMLRRAGLGPKLDEFTLSMNRAAEKAAPQAADIFSSAITQMTFDDVQKVFKGGNTAGTEYLKSKTSGKLLAQFTPTVRKAMDDYAVTKKCAEIVDKAKTIPLVGRYAAGIDIEKYVSSRALDGLFTVLGQQEAKIRTDPAARATSLLKEVFK